MFVRVPDNGMIHSRTSCSKCGVVAMPDICGVRWMRLLRLRRMHVWDSCKLWLRNGLSRPKRSISDYCTIVYSTVHYLPVSYLPWREILLPTFSTTPLSSSSLPLFPSTPPPLVPASIGLLPSSVITGSELIMEPSPPHTMHPCP